jgi:hypothetical protein
MAAEAMPLSDTSSICCTSTVKIYAACRNSTASRSWSGCWANPKLPKLSATVSMFWVTALRCWPKPAPRVSKVSFPSGWMLRIGPGRQTSWLIAKCLARQEFIIVGFSTARAGDRALGALYLGYRKDGAIVYAGKVGTGFTLADAATVHKKLAPLEVKLSTAAGGAESGASLHSLGQVFSDCEVAFGEWTDDGRIRHASFQSLREDKSAQEVNRETPQAMERRVKVVGQPPKSKGAIVK